MEYIVTSESATKILETSGTLQNKDKVNEVEISDSPTSSGFILKPSDYIRLNDTQLYARCVGNNQTANIGTYPFYVDGGGGGSSGGAVGQGVMIDGETYHVIDTTDTDDLIDSYFPD